jgi:hypothetical protein
MSPLCVERVVKLLPHAQSTRISLYEGWMAAFMVSPISVLNDWILKDGLGIQQTGKAVVGRPSFVVGE